MATLSKDLAPLRTTGKETTVLVVLVAVIVLASVFAYAMLSKPSSTKPTPSSGLVSSSTSASSSATALSSQQSTSLGLALGLSVSTNSTGALFISTNETNLLNRVNNVTTANNWPFPDTNSSPCGDYNQLPIRYAVLQGYYDKSNYSSAAALDIYDPAAPVSCPTVSAPIPYLLFDAFRDSGAEPCYASECRFSAYASLSVGGYWKSSGQTWTFQRFPSGTYTVLAEDEWGHVVLSQVSTGVTSSQKGFMVTFRQVGACSPLVYTAPWSLSIQGNEADDTQANLRQQLPANSTLPTGGGYAASSDDANFSTMVFTLPAGNYTYEAEPNGAFYNPTGSFTVNNYNFSIILEGPIESCETYSNSVSYTTATTVDVAAPANCPSSTTCASFSYNSTSQVQVDSVQATQEVCQGCGAVDGQSYVKFLVTIENRGSTQVLISSGSGGGLSASFAQDSGLQKVASYACYGITSPILLAPGGNVTLYSPACHDAFVYQLVRTGNVTATFDFSWTTNLSAVNPADFMDSTIISAQFVFQ